MKKRILSVIMIITLFLSSTNVQAKTNDVWIIEKLSDYLPFQALLQEYPDAINVMSNTSYVLNEVIESGNGDIIKADKKIFKDLDSLQNYESKLKSNNEKYLKSLQDNVTPSAIGSGEYFYTYYSAMKIGLTQYKYSSSYYFVACVFEWLTLPQPSGSMNGSIEGILGLAMNPQLSIEGSSYDGRISYTSTASNGNTSTMLNVVNGGINIKATDSYGIAFDFSVPNFSYYNIVNICTSMDGVISCNAHKSNIYDNYCSILGEYVDVKFTITPGSFSVSYPVGISVNFGTIKSRFPVQNSIDIR